MKPCTCNIGRRYATICQDLKERNPPFWNEDVPTTIEVSLSKIDHFSSSDCGILNNHEGQEAYSQTGRGYPLPDLWRGPGERCELSTGQPRTGPHRDRRLIAED
jgi:hypothetical protein